MESTFKLTVTGIQPGQDHQIVQARFREWIKGNSAEIEKSLQRILTQQPVVLAENLPQERASNLLKKLSDGGLACRLDPMQLTLMPIDTMEENTPPYRCPACGHKQPPTPDGSDICERCGVVGRNYQGVNEYKIALEAERQRLRSMLDREKTEQAKKGREWVEKQREKLQQEMLDQARRQAEKELNIDLRYKIKQLFKPRILIPILGSTTVAVIGVGLLVWQLGIPDASNATADHPAGFKIQIAPSPNAVFKVEGAPAQSMQANSDNAGSTLAETLSQREETKKTVNQQEENVPPMATSDSTIANVDTGAALNATKTGSTTTSVPGTGTTITVHLLDLDKVALALSVPSKTAKPSAIAAKISNSQLLIDLARYQAETGDLSAAGQSLERASELLEKIKHDNPTAILPDAVSRNRTEILATIAYQHHQRQALSLAQSEWYQAMNLANTIVAPSERAQAFANIARTLQGSAPATAGSYFNRAVDSARILNDSVARAITLGAIARDLTDSGQFQQAEDLFAQVTAAIVTIADSKMRMTTQCIIAKYRAEAGDNTVARTLLEQIASQSKKIGSRLECDRHQADTQSAIARNLAKSGDILSARAEFAAALDRVVKLKDPEARASAMLYLARNLAAGGDLESAARIVAVALQDSGIDPDGAAKSRA